jgi:class 3 adenylate cyclase/tetratricopeptide (TPR) repeat protein
VAALEERIDADLQLGRHVGVVAELEALCRVHPLRERLRGQLMLALYRAGRQVEALQVYRDARRTMTEQLGLLPGPELQRLESAILRQDAALTVKAATAATGKAREPHPPATHKGRRSVAVLVGRGEAPTVADPEALQRLQERYREAAAEVTERHGGHVEGVQGNQVTAVFGVPYVREDDAVRALTVAVELRERFSTASEPIATRAGIATGEVVIGDFETGQDTIAGEPLSVAADLQGAARQGEILIAEGTRALLGDAATTERAGEHDQHVWRLVELVPPRPALAGPRLPAIVGREHELSQLEAALARAARGRSPHLFTILGPPGIGKSRLAGEFASGVAADATVVAGRCVSYGEGITFWPLREIVAQLAASTRLAELLGGDDEDAARAAERITEAIGLMDATSSLEEIFSAFRRLFEAVARRRPLVVVFEDAHWAEPTLLDFIEYLAERGRDAPLLLVCLARPELLEARPTWGGGKRNASALLLEALTSAESEDLIDARASGLPQPARARALETAEGNPLFIEQIVAMLVETGEPDGEVPIPPTIQAVLAARLDRLDIGERALIEGAAVIGREFRGAAVAYLLPADARDSTPRRLDTLVDKELLQPARFAASQDTFRFRHVLIQQVAYRGIPKRRRATLHESVADWLRIRFGEDAPEYAEIAGFHLEQAYRYRGDIGPLTEADRRLSRRAANLLASAGKRAFARGDMPASVNLLGRAAELLPDADAAAAQLLPDYGYALFEVGELERSKRVLGEAVKRARATRDRGLEWNATVKQAHALMFTDPETVDPAKLIRTAEAAIAGLEQLDDQLGLSRAWCLLSEVRWAHGEMVKAARAALRGAQCARTAGSRREEAWALAGYAYALLYGPMPAGKAARRTDALVRGATENPVLEASLSGFLACHEAMLGRVERARRRSSESCERLRELGLKWQAGVQELLSGYIELLASDPASAQRHMLAARATFVAIGDRLSLSSVSVDLPRAAYECGQFETARALAEAIDEVPAPADREWQIKRRGIRARLLAHDGKLEEAQEAARDGTAIAAQTDLVWFHADVLLDLAYVLKAAGEISEAANTAKAALALYERKENLASAATARGVLEQLGSVRH